MFALGRISRLICAVVLGFAAIALPASAATLRYAGQLESRNGGEFGQTSAKQVFMRFAILNQAKTTVLWTSTPLGTNLPARLGTVPVTVTDGRFEIVLGEPPTELIDDAVLPASGIVYLRVWIAESSLSVEQLSDQVIPVIAFVRGAERQPGNWRLVGTALTTQGVLRVGIGVESPATTLDVAGETTTHVLNITGGSDIAESFEPVDEQRGVMTPGSIVVASTECPGRIELARRRADPRVVGIVSGANNLGTGLALRQLGSEVADGAVNVAITGRVWCRVDATNNCVQIGDLLETSMSPGVAVRARSSRSQRGIVGKALTELCGEPGLVLVLVSPR